jgi:hypothetical protein
VASAFRRKIYRAPSLGDDGFLKSSGMWNMNSALLTLSMV